MSHILIIAAENDALPGGKIGGIGDVVRDLPKALVKRGHRITVLTPAYGAFNELPGGKKMTSLKVNFGGAAETLELYRVAGREALADVHHYAIEHPLFSTCGKGQIYCNDPAGRPFATDAGKFALFCIAAASAIVKSAFEKIDVIHLHDWHTAFLLILRRYDPVFKALKAIRCAYTIHNLALQGIRPFSGDTSSLQQWYANLKYKPAQLADPRWPDCVNPMAAGIRLADAVHTVSPSYAEEILRPSEVVTLGRYGGEGLEQDLLVAQNENRLFGILNGCEYPKKPRRTLANWGALLDLMRVQLLRMAAASPTLSSALFIADIRLKELNRRRPKFLLTSVGRVTEQKIRLLRQATSSGRPALEVALDALGEESLLVMVGIGDPDYELFLTETAAGYSNFLFLRGYSEDLVKALYDMGDLFLMPSSFEPCGISQMLAMRSGQPCLVHHVGGLRDTVQDNVNGFAFAGNNPTEQADNLVATLKRALIAKTKPKKWQAMRNKAAAKRFNWADSIDAYLKQLYHLV
ncbi:MAG: glycogen/starch synthase [Gammaproteobacteria bacterium]|nr:glycogen/starch synthase [Gammaproteobacteria bacterium]